MSFLFWLFISLIIYVYVGYPVILFIASKIIPKQHIQDEMYLPTVTVMVSAFNEELIIEDKIQNLLKLDYPENLIQFIVCSDCSDDKTDEIVNKYKNEKVALIRQNERLGKTACLNKAMKDIRSDIVVFSDANSMYQSNVIKKLVRNFTDPKIGYVVGMQLYESQNKDKSAEVSYWDYEIYLKKLESKIGSVVGGDGAIYAIRSELYTKLDPTDINDFINPLQIIIKGYRGIYESDAICYEHQVEDINKEFVRKTRIVSRSFQNVLKTSEVLNPFKTGLFSFELISHKILRWMVPLFLILVLLSNLLILKSYVYYIFLFIQIFLYGLVSIIYLNKWLLKFSIFSIPYYFFLVNYASLIGLYQGLTGQTKPIWQPQRN